MHLILRVNTRALISIFFFILFVTQATVAEESSLPGKNEKLSLIEFTISDDSPSIGEEVDLFFRVTTSLWPEEKYRTFFKIKVNGSFVDVDQISENLSQVTYTNTFSSGTYSVLAQLWIEERVLANEIRTQITELEILIANLTSEINFETDPDILIDLREQRDEANAEKRAFESLLRDAQKLLKTENFDFTVQN